MASLSKLLGSLVLVVAVVLGTIWFLDSTRAGLTIKCRVLNDLGACLEVMLTEPVVPGPAPVVPDDGAGGAPTTPGPAQVEADRRARIDRAGSAVASDISDLASSVTSLGSDVASTPADLRTMAADVAATLEDEQQVLTEAQNGADAGTICADAGAVAGDVGTVEGDEGTIDGDGGTIEGDVASIQAAIDQLERDAADLAAARSALPSYADGGPIAAVVSDAISKANAALATARKAYADDLTKAKAYVATANTYADAASKACDQAP